jgi:pimeloyl-ACP methyl ester carboxylesterase
MKPTQSKPSIVFCHGIWADGSCFNKLIPTLQAEGHEVIAVQYGLDSQAADVAATKRTLGRVSSPAILVGHSYGGAVITAAGTDDRVAGLVWMLPEGVKDFAGDLPEQEQKVVWATHFAPDADLFNQKVEGTAWKSKPSWSIVATEDRTVHPDLERFLAKRMGATTVEAKSSHVAMLSQPQLVLDVIRKAAKAAHGAAATA